MSKKNSLFPEWTIIVILIFTLSVLGGCSANDGTSSKGASRGINVSIANGTGNSSESNATFSLMSRAFSNGSMIPSEYTCDGKDIMPPLLISNIPQGTDSLVLIIDDPDAPFGTFLHFFGWNLPVNGTLPDKVPVKYEAKNGFGKSGYNGPCPPSGTHHFRFSVFAVSTVYDAQPASSLAEFERTQKEYIRGKAQLIGLYSRK